MMPEVPATDTRLPAINIQGLSKSFGPVKALVDLDLEVRPGTIFGLLGPNGAGKTTMIRILLDLIRPTAGHASVLGLDVATRSMEVRRRCGYLPGELKLPPGRTGAQFLGHLARIRGDVPMGAIEVLAERLGLDLGRKAGEQSKGNRQKIGLIAAFMSEPELLILDEPTSGLDPIRQQEVQDLMRECAADGRTVLLSSHDLDQVEHVADRVGVIREGALVAHEDVADLRDRAVRDVFVRFDGDPPDLSGIAGTEVTDSGPGFVRVRASGNMDSLVKALAGSSVVTITSSTPDLDEIFLSYYQGRK